MREQLDLRVPDRVALDEIELYAEVLSAVAICDRPLTDAELDAVLGIDAVVTVDYSRDNSPAGCWNITSVPRWAKPSDSYSRMAGVLSSST